MVKKKSTNSNTIARNKKARHNYTLTDKFEGGMSLQGWEIKSIRDGRANLVDSYVVMKGGEAFLVGAHMSPLMTACTHVVAEPRRERKLLLNKKEIARLFAASSQTGHTIVATALYWKGHRVKCEIALAKGKQLHDKRATEKDRDWSKQKHRILMKA